MKQCWSSMPVLVRGLLLGILLGCILLSTELALWLTKQLSNATKSTTGTLDDPMSIFALRIPTCATWQQTGITVAGNASGSEGFDLRSLKFPTNIFVDDTDTLWVNDQSNYRIMKYQSTATVGTVVAGNGTCGNTAQLLNGSKGVTVDRSGVLFVADSNNYRIQIFPEGTKVGVTWIQNTSSNPLGQMRDLHVDVNNNIYFTDSDYNRVLKYTPYSRDGTVLAGGSSGSGANQLNGPFGSFIDKNDIVYVADSNNHRIMKFLPGENSGKVVAGVNCSSGTGLNELQTPQAVVVDNNEYIYIADSGNRRIMRWTTNYLAGGTCIVGCTQTSGINADQLANTRDLKFDKYGNLYVADQSNNRIQKFLINTNCAT